MATSIEWAKVTATTPLTVRLDSSGTDAPANPPTGVTFTIGDRVLVVSKQRELMVLAAYGDG